MVPERRAQRLERLVEDQLTATQQVVVVVLVPIRRLRRQRKATGRTADRRPAHVAVVAVVVAVVRLGVVQTMGGRSAARSDAQQQQ